MLNVSRKWYLLEEKKTKSDRTPDQEKIKMSNSTNETLENEKGQSDGKICNNQRTEPSQEWETMAQAWVAAFPEAKSVVSASEVETWIGSNFESLPADLRQRPLSDLVDRFLSMQQYMRQTASEQNEVRVSSWWIGMCLWFIWCLFFFLTKQLESQADQHPARFQRTDQWLPVYSWLESLDSGELVKSKDISEWLDANPEVKEELSSRHSRYHLTHYVKKCHLKILKRKEKKVKSKTLFAIFFIWFSSVFDLLAF